MIALLLGAAWAVTIAAGVRLELRRAARIEDFVSDAAATRTRATTRPAHTGSCRLAFLIRYR